MNSWLASMVYFLMPTYCLAPSLKPLAYWWCPCSEGICDLQKDPRYQMGRFVRALKAVPPWNQWVLVLAEQHWASLWRRVAWVLRQKPLWEYEQLAARTWHKEPTKDGQPWLTAANRGHRMPPWNLEHNGRVELRTIKARWDEVQTARFSYPKPFPE